MFFVTASSFSVQKICSFRGWSQRTGPVWFCFLSGRSHSERLRDVKLKGQRSCHSNQDHAPQQQQPISTQSGGPSCT